MAGYTIGLDYGSLSVRAVLMDTATGEIAAQSVYDYPHGVMDSLPDGRQLPPGWALQHPGDYPEGLRASVRGVMRQSGLKPEQVRGIGLCCTSATILPVYRDGTPLCLTEAFRGEPHAWVKMWKHHGAEEEAARITRIAKERGEDWLDAYGGKVSSEWTFPKILETLRQAPAVYEKADHFLEAMDWLVWRLTGTLSASACAMGYKAFRHGGRYPSEAFFRDLDPRLEHVIGDKFGMPVLPAGSRAGALTEEAAGVLGLEPGIPVGAPMIDAHASVPGCGVTEPGDMVIIMGTSACHMTLSERDARIPGIQGTVKDGIIPGYYGIEAGQACVGEHFAWCADTCLPEAYALEAREKGMNAHQLLTEKLKGRKAGESGLIALDWFNGVRTPLMDYDLSGLILGLSLRTRPEDIYLALIEATVFGTRAIVESVEEAGVRVNRIILAGGIPEKNALVNQVCADALNRPVILSTSKQASALGAAAMGAAAAEGIGLKAAAARLGAGEARTWLPRPDQAGVYDSLYREYVTLRDYFGRGGNGVMKRLRALSKN